MGHRRSRSAGLRGARFARGLLGLALVACSAPGAPLEPAGEEALSAALSPARWSPALRAEAFARFDSFDQPIGSASGTGGMIAATTGSPAVAAGREALRAGGSAVDAVLTAALAEVPLAAQTWVSYAGILTLVVFDPETGRVHSLDAGYAIPREETEPRSIPTSAAGEQAGRTVLVPGFFAGVAAAHSRFGRLPFAELFLPAIEFAEQGFELSPELAGLLAVAAEKLAWAPDARRRLRGEDGSALRAGELFRQPELAATLRLVAADGLAHVSTGPWAEHFVEQVRAAGGRVALADLAAHHALWSEPVRTLYHGYEVCAVGAPGLGGVNVVEALNVLTAADLGALSDPVERLFWWIQTMNLQVTSFLDRPSRWLLLGADIDDERRTTEEWGEELWERMRTGALPLARAPPGGSHSDALVAVNRRGMVAALVHSSNTGNHWATGIVVDGIVVPDSASFQQDQIAMAGPGARLPDPTNPLIVLRDGRPVLASSSIGAGLHPHTLQRLVAVLDDGLDPAAALAVPALHFAAWEEGGVATAQVSAGDFAPELLEDVRALGQPIRELDARARLGATGYWVGIRIDPASGRLEGACPARLNGAVFGE